MTKGRTATARVVAFVGPFGSGKTSLMEAMLRASGAIPRQGSVATGTTIGGSNPEARAWGHSTEMNVASFDYLDAHYTLLDCPGSVEFSIDAGIAPLAADLTIVVAESDPAKAAQLQPILKALDAMGAPHAIFINKIDKAAGRLRDLIEAIQPYSVAPLVARQVPIRRGEGVIGFIDVALERTFLYQPGRTSQQIDIPPEEQARTSEAREHLLEQIADFDDRLLEQLVNDQAPEPALVFADLAEELERGQIVPVFLGAAEQLSGVRRLLKALRHETPDLSRAAARVGGDGRRALVLKVRHAGQAGRQTLARVFDGAIADGETLTGPDGDAERIAGVVSLQGETQTRCDKAGPGDIVCFGRLESAQRGDVLSAEGKALPAIARPARPPVFALAIEASDRQDEVKLGVAMGKLIDEDPSLSFMPDPQTREFKLSGQGEIHLRAALARLKRKFGVSVVSRRPRTAFRETIRAQARQRGRLKKQTGGHGQFAEVVLEVRPAARGVGFVFTEKVHGGSVPRQYFSAVEAGVRDALEEGPLGAPVIDVEAVLLDGAYHAVDSSETAFRTASRIAIWEALLKCQPVLLEPVHALTIHTPSDSLSRITGLLPMRRGQILGMIPREDWPGWDSVSALLPEEGLHDLILEVRSATSGLGEIEARFDHLAETARAPASRTSALGDHADR